MENTQARPVETWEQQRERERKEEKTRQQISLKKMREVSKVLGYKITKEAGKGKYKEHTNHAFVTLESPDGVVLDLQGEGWRMNGRIEIRGAYPKDKRGQDTRSYVVGYGCAAPHITVSVDRTAEQIAKAITSRLMPQYLPQLAKAKELVKSWDTYQENRESTFKTVMGRDPNEHERDGKTRLTIGKLDKSQEYDTNADIYISSSYVKLTIDNVPPVMARGVLDLLKAHALKGEE